MIWAIVTRIPAAVWGVAAIASEASAVVADKWSPLINLGAIGCILVWFLVKAEPRMRAIEAAIVQSSKALLIAVIAMRGIDSAVKGEAQELLRDIQAKTEPK